MKKNEDEITELFHSRLKNYEIPLQEEMWDELESELSKPSPPRLYSICLIAAAAIFLLLFACSAAVWMFAPRKEISSSLSKAAPVKEKDRLMVGSERRTLPALIAEIEEQPQSFPKTAEVVDSTIYLEKKDTITPVAQPEVQQKEAVPVNGNKLLAEVTENNEEEDEPHLESDWSIGVSAAVGGGKEVNAVGENHQTLDIHHKVPLSLGITVSRKLTDNLALESGLSYTVTRSKITDQSASTVTDQTIKYVGIPLKLNWTLINQKKFDIYVSGGGLMEECVSAKAKTNYYSGNELHDTQVNSLTLNGLQFSLTSSIGLQYKTSESLAFYAEPGLAYYLDDHTPASTIRKNRSVNFYVSCGVKLMY